MKPSILILLLAAAVSSLRAEPESQKKPSPRFSKAQLEVFNVTTDPYYLNGKWVDPGAARLKMVQPLLALPDPDLRDMAESTRDFLKVNRLVDESVARAKADSMAAMKRWQTMMIFDALGSLGRPYDGPVDPNDPGAPEPMTEEERIQYAAEDMDAAVAQAETLMAAGQPSRIRRVELMLLGTSLRKVLRTKAVKIVESSHRALANDPGMIRIKLTRDKGFLWMNVENLTGKPFTNALICARREQDPTRIDPQTKHRGVAAGLMGALGYSAGAIANNETLAKLHLDIKTEEHGAFLFVPELPPKGNVSFIVSPGNDLDITKMISAAMWCDEGKSLRHRADLSRELPQ